MSSLLAFYFSLFPYSHCSLPHSYPVFLCFCSYTFFPSSLVLFFMLLSLVLSLFSLVSLLRFFVIFAFYFFPFSFPSPFFPSLQYSPPCGYPSFSFLYHLLSPFAIFSCLLLSFISLPPLLLPSFTIFFSNIFCAVLSSLLLSFFLLSFPSTFLIFFLVYCYPSFPLLPSSSLPSQYSLSYYFLLSSPTFFFLLISSSFFQSSHFVSSSLTLFFLSSDFFCLLCVPISGHLPLIDSPSPLLCILSQTKSFLRNSHAINKFLLALKDGAFLTVLSSWP